MDVSVSFVEAYDIYMFFSVWIEPILSWKGLIPLSRITYSAFLCHGGLQLYSVAISRQPMYASIFYVVKYRSKIHTNYLLN